MLVEQKSLKDEENRMKRIEDNESEKQTNNIPIHILLKEKQVKDD